MRAKSRHLHSLRAVIGEANWTFSPTSWRQESYSITFQAFNAVGASCLQMASVICVQLDVQNQWDFPWCFTPSVLGSHCHLTQRRSSSGGRRTALCFTACGPLGLTECGDRSPITSAPSGPNGLAGCSKEIPSGAGWLTWHRGELPTVRQMGKQSGSARHRFAWGGDVPAAPELNDSLLAQLTWDEFPQR